MKEQLIKSAIKARENAYAPYSNFHVGAAVLDENNKLYTGCNIENASYGATNCAERTAVFKAVSEGSKKIKAIAVSSDSNEFFYPCGICRQVLVEFADADIMVYCINNKGDVIEHTLGEFLPYAFTDKQMEE